MQYNVTTHYNNIKGKLNHNSTTSTSTNIVFTVIN